MAAQRTALHERHQSHTARFVEFGGWEMPVRYGSIVGEHLAVRRAAGLFDLSHMGELRITGPDAAEGLAGALVGDPRTMVVGRAAYSLLCTPEGGVIDDVIVYRLGEERRVERVFVEPRLADKEFVEPTSGIAAGDRIVIAGQAGLKNDALVSLPGDKALEEEAAGSVETAAGTGE